MKKKLNHIVIVFLIVPLLFASCFYGIKGNGKVVSRTRQVEKFEAVDVSAGLEVILIQDSVYKVVVEADENLQDVIKTEVSHGKLKIFPETSIRHAASRKIYVTIKTIHALEAGSGAEVKSKMELKLPSLEISVSSGANIDLALNSNKLGVEGSSGGRIKLSGSAENLDVDGSSGVEIRMTDLHSNYCNAGASSGANLKVSVSEKLTAKASSGGQIKVSGNPKERNIEKSSGGDVSFN